MVIPIQMGERVRVVHPTLKIEAELPFRLWLNETDNAIAILGAIQREGRKTPQNPMERLAILWLQACDLTTEDAINAYMQRRAALRAPGDPSRVVRCRRCGRRLTHPLSKMLGLGRECLKKENE